MELRKLLLRIMLWSLGSGAAMGVLAVLFGGGELAARVIGTAAVLAVASGLMLRVSPMVDRRQTRMAGVLGMAGIVVEFLLALVLIWEVPRLLIGSRYEEPLILTAIHLGLLLAVSVYFLRHRHSPRAAIVWLPGTVWAIAIFVLLMIATWSERRWYQADDWYKTAGALAATGAVALACLVSMSPGDWRNNWRWAGVVASMVACVLWMGDVWIGSGSDIGLIAFYVSLSSACVLAHANLVLICPVKAEQGWVRTGTIGAVAMTAVLLDLIVIYEEVLHAAMGNEFIARAAGATGIVSACGTMALLVLARLNRNVDFEESAASLPVNITLICPRCRKKQTVPLGPSACPNCELRIHTRIEEPRCPKCEYLLYGLTSDRCPECGTTVSSSEPSLESAT